MKDMQSSVTKEEASAAARDLAKKKGSWNPFKTASKAGETLEKWKEAKGTSLRAEAKRGTSSRVKASRVIQSKKRSSISAKTTRGSSVQAMARTPRKHSSARSKSTQGRRTPARSQKSRATRS